MRYARCSRMVRSMPSASSPSWAMMCGASPWGMKRLGRPSDTTVRAGRDRPHAIGDRHPDAAVADAVLDRDDEFVGCGGGDHRRRRGGRRSARPRPRPECPASASRSAAFVAASTILPIASTHTRPSPSVTRRADSPCPTSCSATCRAAPRGYRIATGPSSASVERVEHHLLQLLGARRREHAHARHVRQHRHVVHAVVRRAVGAGDAGAVEREDHRQAVEGDVVDDLVPGPVEERRVDRDDRPQPAHRHAGGGGDGVLLGDADVEEAVGEVLLERDQPRRPGHRSGDRHDASSRARRP